MEAGTREIVKVAINNDPTMQPDERRKFIALLNGQSTSPKEKLLTTKEACQILGVVALSLRRYEQRGLITPVRYSKRKLRWRESEIREFHEMGIEAGVRGAEA
jgi:predicted DNA-binding transcriptional regulator AlpA